MQAAAKPDMLRLRPWAFRVQKLGILTSTWRSHMRTDEQIERDVKDELRWDPQIDDKDIVTKQRRILVSSQ
jgi:hypothetical protein